MQLKNKQQAKLSLAELEKEMNIVSNIELKSCLGGWRGRGFDPYDDYVWDLGWIDEVVVYGGGGRSNYDDFWRDFGGSDPSEDDYYYGGGSPSYSSQEPQQQYPSDYKPSCVFNVFDYLDGDKYDAYHYYKETKKKLNYEPSPSGAVNTGDISKIGSYGGFEVVEISKDYPMNKATGRSYPGNNPVMMTFFDPAEGIDHAVVVRGVRVDQGNIFVQYYDPTSKQTGERRNRDYSALYEVIKKN